MWGSSVADPSSLSLPPADILYSLCSHWFLKNVNWRPARRERAAWPEETSAPRTPSTRTSPSSPNRWGNTRFVQASDWSSVLQKSRIIKLKYIDREEMSSLHVRKWKQLLSFKMKMECTKCWSSSPKMMKKCVKYYLKGTVHPRMKTSESATLNLFLNKYNIFVLAFRSDQRSLYFHQTLSWITWWVIIVIVLPLLHMILN